MLLSRYIVELHGPDSAPAEESSAERWAMDDQGAMRLVTDWIHRTPDLDLSEEYEILVMKEDQ